MIFSSEDKRKKKYNNNVKEHKKDGFYKNVNMLVWLFWSSNSYKYRGYKLKDLFIRGHKKNKDESSIGAV